MKNFYAKLTKVNMVGQKSQFCSPIIIVEREERKRKLLRGYLHEWPAPIKL
jgi:hypothetical protein